jgi:cytochrome c biogenesis protein CcdA
MYKILGADQKEYGPVTLEQLKQWVREGRANAQTLIQGPDSTEWKPLGTFPEMAGMATAAPAPPPAGPVYGTATAAANVPTYLWQSIVVTLCCCLPLGVVAIIYSAQVNSKLSAGDMTGAVDASKKARMWCWIALAGGLVGFAIGIILQAVGMTWTKFQQ